MISCLGLVSCSKSARRRLGAGIGLFGGSSVPVLELVVLDTDSGCVSGRTLDEAISSLRLGGTID